MVFINRTRYETPSDLMSAGAMFMAERARFFFFFFFLLAPLRESVEALLIVGTWWVPYWWLCWSWACYWRGFDELVC